MRFEAAASAGVGLSLLLPPMTPGPPPVPTVMDEVDGEVGEGREVGGGGMVKEEMRVGTADGCGGLQSKEVILSKQ